MQRIQVWFTHTLNLKSRQNMVYITSSRLIRALKKEREEKEKEKRMKERKEKVFICLSAVLKHYPKPTWGIYFSLWTFRSFPPPPRKSGQKHGGRQRPWKNAACWPFLHGFLSLIFLFHTYLWGVEDITWHAWEGQDKLWQRQLLFQQMDPGEWNSDRVRWKAPLSAYLPSTSATFFLMQPRTTSPGIVPMTVS